MGRVGEGVPTWLEDSGKMESHISRPPLPGLFYEGDEMRGWTYLLPAGLWLWLVRKRGERLPVAGYTAYDGGEWLIINSHEARAARNDNHG